MKFLFFTIILFFYFQNVFSQNIEITKYNTLFDIENVKTVCIDEVTQTKYFATKNLGVLKLDMLSKKEYSHKDKDVFYVANFHPKSADNIWIAVCTHRTDIFTKEKTFVRYDTLKGKKTIEIIRYDTIYEKIIDSVKVDSSKIQIKKIQKGNKKEEKSKEIKKDAVLKTETKKDTLKIEKQEKSKETKKDTILKKEREKQILPKQDTIKKAERKYTVKKRIEKKEIDTVSAINRNPKKEIVKYAKITYINKIIRFDFNKNIQTENSLYNPYFVLNPVYLPSNAKDSLVVLKNKLKAKKDTSISTIKFLEIRKKKEDSLNLKALESMKITEPISITSVFAEEEHIWISTANQGLFVFYRNNYEPLRPSSKYYNLIKELNKKEKYINQIVENGNFIWIATHGGIYTIQTNTATPTLKMEKKMRNKSVNMLAKYKTLICAGLSSGKIWKKDITNINKGAEWTEVDMPLNTKQKLGKIESMDFDSEGRLWVAGRILVGFTNKLQSIDKKDKAMPLPNTPIPFEHQEKDNKEKNFDWINAISIDKKNKIWIASNRGVHTLDINQEKNYNIRITKIETFNLKNSRAYKTKKANKVDEFVISFKKDKDISLRGKDFVVRLYKLKQKTEDDKKEITLKYTQSSGDYQFSSENVKFDFRIDDEDEKNNKSVKKGKEIKKSAFTKGKYIISVYYKNSNIPVTSAEIKF